MGYGKDVRDELRVPSRDLRHAIPQVYAGHKQLYDAALSAGALDVRTKELIALATAVSKECDGCIAAHAHAAVTSGATPAEAAEAIGVTFLMNGGPSTVYGRGPSPRSRSSTPRASLSRTGSSRPPADTHPWGCVGHTTDVKIPLGVFYRTG